MFNKIDKVSAWIERNWWVAPIVTVILIAPIIMALVSGISEQTEQLNTRMDSVVAVSAGELRGSGFVVDDDKVVTNSHVTKGAETVQLSFENGYEVEGHVLYELNEPADLAVVQFEGEPNRYEVADLGCGYEAERGEPVNIMGHPQGVKFVETQGYVASDLTRDVGGFEFIVLDNTIGPGNSGGPVFVGNQVVGVLTAGVNTRYGLIGLGLAQPISVFCDTLIGRD